MNVLLVDAYDSFTHIIDQYLRMLGADTDVVRSRTLTPRALLARQPDAVVLGPGPGHPRESGHVELVHAFAGRVPLLGICLGHQAIGLAYGGRVDVAERARHGKTSPLRHDASTLYAGIGQGTRVTRYHSLVVAPELPPPLTATAHAEDDGAVMGLRHRSLAVHGVQFHPESIATDHGMRLIENFLGTVGTPDDPGTSNDLGASSEPGALADCGALAEPGTSAEPGTLAEPGASAESATSHPPYRTRIAPGATVA
ncbi:aminodeoxychorismate/anthranilate synthase component II [Streptomyces sp. VRA16 Mangrove soil]|nr:aminodeoxychorismate/anthranilate synthase component II [Streptomyces sp. VRA16 Mangrove soil]